MRRTGLLILLLLVALLAPASAWASQADDDFLKVFKEYATSGGQLDACTFSSKLLASAKKGVSPDTEAYAPDLEDAIDAALRARASGACDKKASGGGSSSGAAPAPTGAGSSGGSSTPAPTTQAVPAPEAAAPAPAPAGTVAPTQTPAPAAEPVAAPATSSPALAAERVADEDDGTPAPLVGLGAIGVLLLVGGLLWLLARGLAWEPGWATRSRHVTGEAGWRVSAAWSEFTDWVRLGR